MCFTGWAEAEAHNKMASITPTNLFIMIVFVCFSKTAPPLGLSVAAQIRCLWKAFPWGCKNTASSERMQKNFQKTAKKARWKTFLGLFGL